MNSKTLILIAVFFLFCAELSGAGAARQVWRPDNRDGTYTNPIIFADYSDPDVIRVGDEFYMTASSFNCSPGLPILHSRDLVRVSNGALSNFSFSGDGKTFAPIGETFTAREGRWIGAKIGLFCLGVDRNPGGHADFDWFRFGSSGQLV